jgi:hypothetical protein
MIEGALDKMVVHAGEPALYQLAAGSPGAPPDRFLDLARAVGGGLEVEFLDRISCSHCGADTPKSYGGGYCYRCFTTLARCDLCVVSPARCHFAEGTCREPDWGESHCMRPHLVYLANSSGPKVGITTLGGEVTRWLDQGASQGLVVADASTRHLAGVVEATLARLVSDRTDWRALLREDAAPVDLAALRDRLRTRIGPLPDGVSWRDDGRTASMSFPVASYPARLERLTLDDHGRIAGKLVGIKGQYLLFEHGVLNVRRHRGYHVRARRSDGPFEPAPAPADTNDSQMELFS